MLVYLRQCSVCARVRMRVCVRSNSFCSSLISVGSQGTWVWPWALRPLRKILLLLSSLELESLFQHFREKPNEMEPIHRTSEGDSGIYHTETITELALALSLCFSFSYPSFTDHSHCLSFLLFNLKLPDLSFVTGLKVEINTFIMALQKWPCGGQHRSATVIWESSSMIGS